MATGRNWDKYNRKVKAAQARQKPTNRSTIRATFEALAHYLAAGLHEGGNFVIVPGSWQELSDADLHSRRIAHRKRSCAENKKWCNPAAGDRWVRVADETVEALDIQNCEICASFVRRN